MHAPKFTKNQSLKPWLCVAATLLLPIAAYPWVVSNFTGRNAAKTEMYVGSGMGPDVMTGQVTSYYEEPSPQSYQQASTDGRRQSLTLTMTVGCAAEDIFGSREAFLAMFDTNEDDAEAGTRDEWSADSPEE
jgi:hypothetical protein